MRGQVSVRRPLPVARRTRPVLHSRCHAQPEGVWLLSAAAAAGPAAVSVRRSDRQEVPWLRHSGGPLKCRSAAPRPSADAALPAGRRAARATHQSGTPALPSRGYVGAGLEPGPRRLGSRIGDESWAIRRRFLRADGHAGVRGRIAICRNSLVSTRLRSTPFALLAVPPGWTKIARCFTRLSASSTSSSRI
jgi:hypothetical protein